MTVSTGSIENKRILYIDDDLALQKLVHLAFSKVKAQLYTASDGEEGLRQFYTLQPDLVILDLMMPGTDGWEVCQQIRRLSDVPIVMLTALGQDKDIIRGLRCGADDYVAKPISLDVLIARSQAALRRGALTSETKKPSSYSDDYLIIDLDKHQVLVKGKRIKLTTKEYQLLTYLLQNAGQIVTFEQILERIWGWEYRESIDYVHVYISNLRRKLEQNPRHPQYLQTEHGFGYRFVTPNSGMKIL